MFHWTHRQEIHVLKFLRGVKSNVSTHLLIMATNTSGSGQPWGSLPVYGEQDRVPGDLYWLWKWEEALVHGNGHYCHCCFCYEKLLVLFCVLCQLPASLRPEIWPSQQLLYDRKITTFLAAFNDAEILISWMKIFL